MANKDLPQANRNNEADLVSRISEANRQFSNIQRNWGKRLPGEPKVVLQEAQDLGEALRRKSFLANDSKTLSAPAVIISRTPKILRLHRDFYFDIFADLARKNEAAFGFEGVYIPKDPGGYEDLICIPPSRFFGDEMAFSGGKKQYKINYRYHNNMDIAIRHDLWWSRDSWRAPYVVRTRPFDEADEDMKGKSAAIVWAEGIDTLTFKERAVYQRFLLLKGKVLDKKTVTNCTASRYSDGLVPGLDGRVGGVSVGWCSLDRAHDRLRVRRAVSVS
jgi:hypothetical protein